MFSLFRCQFVNFEGVKNVNQLHSEQYMHQYKENQWSWSLTFVSLAGFFGFSFSFTSCLISLCSTGKLIGRFYSESGKPTDVLQQTEASLAKGLKLKAQAEKENELHPACNSEWSSDRGGRVWCSTKRWLWHTATPYNQHQKSKRTPKNWSNLHTAALMYKAALCFDVFSSGGVHRDWAGVPRKLFSPGSGHMRCVCVRPDDPTQSNSPNLQQYKDCPPQAESCLLSWDLNELFESLIMYC